VLALERLERVLEAEDLVGCLARLLRPRRGIAAQDREPPLEDGERDREVVVALRFELRERVEPFGAAGVPRDEDQFPVGGPARVPLQMVPAFDGLTVFVDAEEGEVEIVAWIGEVVRVAAEKRDLLLR